MTTPRVVSLTTRRPRDNGWSVVLEIAGALVGKIGSHERYQRVLDGIHALLHCDSAAWRRLEDDERVPVATRGRVPETSALRFPIAEHPRLAQFVRDRRPVRIRDESLPDPFDGLIEGGVALSRVHACMGCALVAGDDLVGVLSVDALEAAAFDDVDDDALAAVACLAAAAIRTTDMIEQLERNAERAGLVVRELAHDTTTRVGGELLGRSPAMEALRAEVALAARADFPVLITGETGVGKEVVARAVHDASRRAAQPLIYLNCAALPETIAESELFGHVRGAFTGAHEHRAGKFEVADGGTLFLDEIGELPLSIQPKLLRALQSGEIQRIGADKPLLADVRTLAATNRNLADEIAAGRFRADLFHRLSVLPIEVPPLRERRDDISLLAGHFLDEARRRLGRGRIRLTAEARARIEAAEWAGNVRELQHALLRAALRASGGRQRELVVIEANHFECYAAPATVAEPARPATAPAVPLVDAVDDVKRERLRAALERTHGNWAEAARQLGLDRGNLHRLATRLGLR